jgi:FixJ family two-component response regulator
MAAVLLVGVDDSVQRKMRPALESAGHVVLRATTRRFLEFADEGAVEVVVIDISPLRHGAHLVGIAELRQRHRGLPILAVCGGADAGMLLDIAVQAGADATLRKPFSREQLLDAIERCLAGPAKP